MLPHPWRELYSLHIFPLPWRERRAEKDVTLSEEEESKRLFTGPTPSGGKGIELSSSLQQGEDESSSCPPHLNPLPQGDLCVRGHFS